MQITVPLIRKSFVIPPSPTESIPYGGVVVLFLGFGYDCVRDDYEVIRMVEHEAQNDDDEDQMVHYEFSWEVYSLKSDSWRQLDVNMSCCYAHDASVQLYLDGMCHWWAENTRHYDEACLVSFDLTNEVFFTTPMPSYMEYGFDCRCVQGHLVELNGSIALMSNDLDTFTFHISILGEVGVKESWTKLFVVGPLPNVKYPIRLEKKNIFSKNKDGELAWFDLSTQKIEKLSIEGGKFCSRIIAYKGSHSSILGIDK
ncbi:hypothetical protein VNO78_12510 [Psophocarpus tetragonolobus]|uniref:F-box associated beta-propeller type 1 domain-containing protein n=1 Tax=Psophocarpus tetragonolobus TaxID=3891 RepID=A0AAN9SN51_PSOTE